MAFIVLQVTKKGRRTKMVDVNPDNICTMEQIRKEKVEYTEILLANDSALLVLEKPPLIKQMILDARAKT